MAPLRSQRVLHCIPTLGGGGAERQLTYLSHELVRLGWDVHVACGARGSNWERLHASGATVHELSPGSDWRSFRDLKALIARVEPGLVQTWLTKMDVLGGVAAALSRTPWMLSERASAGAYGVDPKNVLRSLVAQSATAVVSNSSAGDAYWGRRLWTRPVRHVVPNGLPLAEIDAAPPDPSASTLPLVLFAGRFEPQKNIQVLIEALTAVLARHEAEVICCGEGSLSPLLVAWSRSLPDSRRVSIQAYSPRLWSLMKRAAVFVSPANFEGCPNVVLEAMACRTPLVVSDIPEHREHLDGESALLVPARSAADLAGAIGRVLMDPAAAARRAVVARTRAEGYETASMARRYAAIYEALLGRAGGAAACAG